MEDKEKQYEKKSPSTAELNEEIPKDLLIHDHTKNLVIYGQEEKDTAEHSSHTKVILTDKHERFQEEKKKVVEMSSSEDENMSSPSELEIPNRPPPSESSKMMLLKTSNVFGIQPKPFDPETYDIEEDASSNKSFHLVNNIVRWREVKDQDGSINRESNARFVRWSDGSMQLLIGNEAFDVTKQDIENEHKHLYRQHEEGTLQSKGKILNKLMVMPSSLSSSSHSSLTALVDSQEQRSPKVKSCTTEIDPEWLMKENQKVEKKKVDDDEEHRQKKKKKKTKAANSKEDKEQGDSN